MTFAQQLEYLRMSETEKAKIKEKVLIEERKEKAKKEKEQKLKESKEPKSKNEKKKKVYVYVLNMRGKTLMPTSQMKEDNLLTTAKAKVVQRCPFKIQLNYPTGENKQRIRSGFDSGYKHLGISCVTDSAELFSADVELRTDIPDLLNEKKMYRTNRRERNTRYREPRFDNRGGEDRREGWLPPSTQHKLDSHVRLINYAKQCLPINDKDITIEVGTFDTQKMQNPEISGIEYQQGTLQGYEIREYLLEKWCRKCAYCKRENLPLRTYNFKSQRRD